MRWIQIGKTREDALDRIRNYDLDIWKNFYAAMGRRKVENDDYFGSLVSSGLFVFGSVDEVRRELLEQWRVFPAEYITLINHYAQSAGRGRGDQHTGHVPAAREAGARRGNL